jgi:hypothetical protein
MILSAPPAESVILSARAESIILSMDGAKQHSTKSCSGDSGVNGGGRGNSGSNDVFGVGSSDDDCSDDSNGDGDVDGDSGDDGSGKDDPAESIMLAAGLALRVSYSQ